MLRLVPFNASWVSARGQSGAILLDIKAIYRRPARDPETLAVLTDEAGFPLWDVTGGIPVAHHTKWVARGFEYVTLADGASLTEVSKGALADQGVSVLPDPGQYLVPGTQSPWDGAQYQRDVEAERATRIEQLRQNIREHGRAAAEAIERQSDPDYRIPDTFHVEPSAAPEPEPEPESDQALTRAEKMALSRGRKRLEAGGTPSAKEQAALDKAAMLDEAARAPEMAGAV